MKTCKYLLIIVSFSITFQINGQFKFPEFVDLNSVEGIEEYSNENLWEYINGAAPSYLKYEFLNLKIKEYKYNFKDYILAEVYKHSSPINAFGMYAFEKPTKTNYLKIGGEGYLEDFGLNFYADSFYIKIVSNKSSDQTKVLMRLVANEIIKKNKLQNGLVSDLKLFPADSIIKHSEKYYPKNYMGHSFLTNVLEATYRHSNQEIKLFIIDKPSKRDALNCIKDYLKFANQETISNEKELIFIEDLFNGFVVLKQKKDKVFGIYGTEDKELITKLMRNFL